jgi:hypothetical protein
MQLHAWTFALMALGNMQVASSHIIRTPFASPADVNDMDDITAASLSFAQPGL